MSFPHIRPITISVSLAVAAMAYSVPATATQSNNRVALESVIALDPSRATPATDSASFVSADRIEGNPEEQLHLYGQAEIRRAGTVLKGDRITYTQATDEVQAEGNAKISRLGATFSGPSMRFKITMHSILPSPYPVLIEIRKYTGSLFLSIHPYLRCV